MITKWYAFPRHSLGCFLGGSKVKSLFVKALLVPSAAAFLSGLNVSEARAGVIFTNLHSFTGGSDGAIPYAGLIQGSDGNFYGTTSSGGDFGKGLVFKMTPDGAVTNLVTFTGTNGANPEAVLLLGKDGSLYGTTSSGGTGNGGTVFRISGAGAFTNIANFYSWDGGSVAGLLQDTQGNLYGTTPTGGTTQGGNGTVFEVGANNALNTLAVFSESNGDGRGPGPQSGLIQGRDGNFYGTTMYGGTNGLPATYASEDGMVFQMTPGGSVNVIASFNGGNGAFPVAGLTQGADQSFYGTAEGGGASSWGTVFQVTTNGLIKSLYAFSGGADGGNPQAGLIQDGEGHLYGTAMEGGINDNGTVFEISTNGTLTTLYSFSGDIDGRWPHAGLLKGNDGNFYGTTLYGGQFGNGVIFRITVAPPAPLFLSAHRQGTQFVITWPSEAGSTYQVQCNPGLSSTNWTNLGDPIAAGGTGLSVTNSASVSQQFYRVLLLPP